jgi:transposase
VADANGRPLSFFMTAGQISDYTSATALLDDLPKAQWLLGGCDWLGIPCRRRASSPASQAVNLRYDKRHYRGRSRIEIMFGRLKDWRRVATPLRPVSNDLLLRRRPRCHRHLLAMTNET